MFCKHCGDNLSESTKFCGKCGGKNLGAITPAEPPFKVQEGFFKRISTGRLGRRNYFFGILYTILPIPILVTLWGTAVFLLGQTSPILVFLSMIVPLLIGLAVLWFFCSLPIVVCMTIRRCHDFGISGWFILLGGVMILISLFPSSNKGLNEYGQTPMKDRKFLSDIFNN